MERLHQSGCRSPPQRLVRNPYPPERGDYLPTAEGGRGDDLGYGLWDGRAAMPELAGAPDRVTAVAHYMLPPPCIYVMPATIASPRNNPRPVAQALNDVHLLRAFHDCFRGRDEEVNYVDFEVEHQGAETMRKTTIRRAGAVVRESRFTPIQRA